MKRLAAAALVAGAVLTTSGLAMGHLRPPLGQSKPMSVKTIYHAAILGPKAVKATRYLKEDALCNSLACSYCRTESQMGNVS